MRNFFSICIICSAFCLFADERPIFEETDEKADLSLYSAFSAKVPFLEEDESKNKEATLPASYVSWSRYKSNFGIETVLARFPHSPIVTYTSQLSTAYAYDGPILYSLNAYFPPVGNINPVAWFDEILFSVNQYPFQLISHTIFQGAQGEWIMDYTSHDYVQNLILKARAIVTPFNGYTLQCLKPNGYRDYFDYFLDNFWIRCDCS